MGLDEALIGRRAEEAARVLALELLRRAEEAARRLGEREDAEALHDFRVAVRRLRTVLRAFRPSLAGSVRAKDERKLRRLGKHSNAARDADVHLAFLAQHGDRVRPRHRSGVQFLKRRLEALRAAGPAASRIAARYRKLSSRLAERLACCEVPLEGASSSVAFAAALASALRDELAFVRSRVDAIEGAADEPKVHRARIAVKRLRYLLEPLRGDGHVDARGVVRELKMLQTLLGDLHDVHTLSDAVRDALVDASAERARRLFAAASDANGGCAELRGAFAGEPTSGLLGLATSLRRRRETLFARLERSWRSGALEALGSEVEGIASTLEARAGGSAEGRPPRGVATRGGVGSSTTRA